MGTVARHNLLKNLIVPTGNICVMQADKGKLEFVGFDVLIFIPSVEEDESKITCGNAILSEKSTKRIIM